MKKWLSGVLIGSFFMLLILRKVFMKNPLKESPPMRLPIPVNLTTPLECIYSEGNLPATHSPEFSNQIISAETLLSSLFVDRNFSNQVQSSLLTWNHMKYLVNYSQPLPNGMGAIREAQVAWESLLESVKKREQGGAKESLLNKLKGKQCPYFVNIMNATKFGDNGYRLWVPCGLVQGSTITIIGIPNGLLGNFRIDLLGEQLPGEPEPSTILHYNVRLLGDKITEDSVILQNTWTADHGWSEEERCPASVPGDDKKVDELSQCNKMVGKDNSQKFAANGSSNNFSTMSRNRTGARWYFPFKQGFLSVMTLRMGEEGIQMTVDGKHVTSFAYRENLEPWLVSEVRISGGLKLISVLASGLPSSEESEHIIDLESLKSAQLPLHHPLDLFIGVFSTANNFERRMAVRRTWMQYPAVKTGEVAVRFFVGLHKNQMVNEQLWVELQTYGDIQLMPFVDYYSLITWKTIAICTFGAEVVSAKNVMKTDDDAFVRVDEVLSSLKRTTVSHGLLYGLINYNAQPHRNPFSKWYISLEEWPESFYPPWAHGPGYVVSHDIAKAVYNRHKMGRLKMFKLEDVAMGMWIAEINKGLQVMYVNEDRVYTEGCKDGYIVAHYQSPREMLCLWQNLQEGNEPGCCSGK
ncbi:beta-1,3-galactosyltransferase GALT1 [Ricinus communis]|uniref:beta-1,3-galactosyltransferase GALT1 n=1 Tax=Ricinus communis TaxID=3988 RepID=UPI00201ADFAF|nr:beta-1,3-galactosyltransferase GALT1 [Ricinus communis]